MKTGKIYIIAALLMGIALPGTGLATPQEHAVYTTYKDAENSSQRAEHQALQGNAPLYQALTQIHDAQTMVDHIQDGTSRQIMDAESRLHQAEDHYANMLSGMTGVSMSEISDMHGSGLTWDNVAVELGVEMGGQTMGQQHGVGSQVGQMAGSSNSAVHQTEIMDATMRDTRNGWTQSHGTSIHGGSSHTGATSHMAGNGNMMTGAGGLSNGMASTETGGHDSMGSGMGSGGSASGGGGMGSGSSGGGMGGGMGGSSSGGGMGGMH